MVKVLTAESIYQQIMDLYGVEDSYERWESYRNRLTDYLINNIDKDKSVAILGVGEANDIDLNKIHEYVKKLTLVDIDIDSVHAGLKKYGLENSNKISIVTTDFVGISKKDYIDAIEIIRSDIVKMQSMFSVNETGPKYLRKMEDIFEKVNRHEIDLGIDEHDYVIAVGVHSQLFDRLPWIWEIMLNVVKKSGLSFPDINNKLMEQLNTFIPKFDDAILGCAKEKAFIGIETRVNLFGPTPQGALQANEDIKRKVESKNRVIYRDTWPYRDGLVLLIVK